MPLKKLFQNIHGFCSQPSAPSVFMVINPHHKPKHKLPYVEPAVIVVSPATVFADVARNGLSPSILADHGPLFQSSSQVRSTGRRPTSV
jgi:hypothetical protein